MSSAPILSKLNLRNISLISRIYISFFVVIVVFATSSVISGSYQKSIGKAFTSVEKEAQPIAMQSAMLDIAMLSAHQELIRILNAKDLRDIDSYIESFHKKRENLRTSLQRLEALVNEAESLKDSGLDVEFHKKVKSLQEKIKVYLDKTESLPDRQKNFITVKAKLNVKQADMQSLLNIISTELEKTRIEISDPYIDVLIREFADIKLKLEQNIFNAFKMDKAIDILNSYFENHSVVRELQVKFEDLFIEIPSLENNLEVIYLLPLYRACTEKDGVYYKTYEMMLAKEDVDKKSVDGETIINEAQAILANIEKDASSFQETASGVVYSSISNAISVLISSLVGVIIIVILVCFGLGNSIKKPMEYLMRVMKRAANGDLSSTYDDKNKDEFAIIGSALNTMIIQTRDVINKLVVVVNDLKSTAEVNSHVVDVSNEALDVERKESFMVASSTAELEQTLSQVVESAQRTLDEIINVGKVSEIGRQIMSDNITTTHTLDAKLKETSAAITQVNEMGENIGSVVSVIRGIAEQTNLLALNAAIEAARAGEQGRGFAVVADEVRTLANRTSDSTKQITAVIEQLRSTISKAVSVIASCNAEMETSLEQSSKANSSIEEIMGYIASIDSMSEQIVESAHEQEIATREINKNITRISELSEQNCEGMNDIKKSSANLDRIANEQSEIINRFKL